MRRGTLILVTLLLVVAVVAGSWVFGTRAGAGFGGTDAAATSQIEQTGYQPWVGPLFKPAAEVESGLFALQAALGAGVLGFVLGTLRERRRHRAPRVPSTGDGQR